MTRRTDRSTIDSGYMIGWNRRGNMGSRNKVDSLALSLRGYLVWTSFLKLIWSRHDGISESCCRKGPRGKLWHCPKNDNCDGNYFPLKVKGWGERCFYCKYLRRLVKSDSRTVTWFVFSVGNLYPDLSNATLEMDGHYSATFLSVKSSFVSFFTADTKIFTWFPVILRSVSI